MSKTHLFKMSQVFDNDQSNLRYPKYISKIVAIFLKYQIFNANWVKEIYQSKNLKRFKKRNKVVKIPLFDNDRWEQNSFFNNLLAFRSQSIASSTFLSFEYLSSPLPLRPSTTRGISYYDRKMHMKRTAWYNWYSSV